jgi:2-phosphoglycerate kinase
MLYLVGGVARTGKSTIARRFLVETGTPFFALDYLMMGCHAAPQLEVDPNEGDRQTAAKLAPIVKAMATAMLENGEEYLLEGVQLLPRIAAELNREFPGQVCAAFVGYAEIDLLTKVQQLRHFDGGNNDWLRHESDEELLATVARLKAMSQWVRTECENYGLPYFDTSTNFTATLDRIVDFLKTIPQVKSHEL